MGNMLKVSTQMQQGNLCTFMQIAEDINLGGVVDRPDVCAAIQRDAESWRIGLQEPRKTKENDKSCTWGKITHAPGLAGA